MGLRHVVAVGLIVSVAAHGQPRDPGQVAVRQAATTEGQPVLIRNYASWRADCTLRMIPTVAVDVQPQHGTVSVRPGTSTIREYIGDGSHCVGQQLPGVAVWYQPQPGFRGTDQFALTITTSRPIHDQVTVEVR